MKLRAFPALSCAFVLAACGHDGGSSRTAAETVDRDSRSDDGPTHTLVTTAPLLGGKTSPYEATTAFLARHAELGIVAPARALRGVLIDHDALGMTHARMEQVVNGVRVEGAELIAHYDASGRLASLDSRLVPGLVDLDVTPIVAPSDAVTAAATSYAAKAVHRPTDGLRAEHDPELVIRLDEAKKPVLAWALTLTGHDALLRYRTYVDAKTGAIVHAYDDLKDLDGRGIGIKGDQKTLAIEPYENGYRLRETTRTTNGVGTGTLQNGTNLDDATFVLSNTTTSFDADVPTGKGSAVDAHAYAAFTFDYYKKEHGRASWDGKDGQLISIVHVGQDLDNAFWNGSVLLYGDGDPALSISYAVDIDMVAHEFTHAVTDTSSKLVYEAESGALNESVSDIFGAIVEHLAKPDPVKNWQIGHQSMKDGRPIRDMIRPALSATRYYEDPPVNYNESPTGKHFPAHMKEYAKLPNDDKNDFGGVHINSSIPNQAPTS